MLKAKAIRMGSHEPEDVFLTRQFAIRLYCDCFRHLTSMSRKSWVFLLATDRDSLAMFIKRADEHVDVPWMEAAHYNEHEIVVCGARIAVADPAPEIDANTIMSADDAVRSHLVGPPMWWRDDERPDTANRRERELEAARVEYERKRKLGLVDGSESDRPREFDNESRAAAWRRKRAEQERAQPRLNMPDAQDDAPRDLEEHE